jgi:hypothetical protein
VQLQPIDPYTRVKHTTNGRQTGRRGDAINWKVFQQRARDCLNLAAESSELYAREALIELSAEFTQMADEHHDLRGTRECNITKKRRFPSPVTINSATLPRPAV